MMNTTTTFQTVAVSLSNIMKGYKNIEVKGKVCSPLCGQLSRTGGTMETCLLSGKVLPALSGNTRLSALQVLTYHVSLNDQAFNARLAASYAHIEQKHTLNANDLHKLSQSMGKHWQYLGNMPSQKGFNDRFLSVYGDTEKSRKTLKKINNLFATSWPAYKEELSIIRMIAKQKPVFFSMTASELQNTIMKPEILLRETTLLQEAEKAEITA